MVLNAEKLAFYDGEGQEQLYFDPAAGCYKFRGMLNVNDNFVVDKLGNVTMKGSINMSSGSITWGGNIPNKKRYAASTGGPWHDTMQSGDIYCCDWDYQINDWGTPYQFVGKDGRPGSDATVPKYITDTVIAKGVIEAPQINANNFGIYPPNSTTIGGSFNLFGNYDGVQRHFLKILYGQGSFWEPTVFFDSPGGAKANWEFLGGTLFTGPVQFTGVVDFGDNHVTAVFG